MITAVPEAIPDTIPLASTEAVAISLLLQLPGRGRHDNPVADPSQTDKLPVIVPGNPFTPSARIAIHPVGSV